MGTRTSCVDPKTGSLWTECCSDGRRLLLRPLVVKIDDGYLITVPAGFVTDFSSTPSGVGWVMDWSKVDVAGVVHDWLYADGSLDRRKADRIWKDIALRGQHSANGLQAWLGRGALLLFGWRAWNRHRRHDSPVSPDEAPRAPDNDEELKNCADSLVRRREEKQLERELVATRMGALPTVIDRFERMGDDADFRLVSLLRYAAAIGASLRLTDGGAAIDDNSHTTNGEDVV